MINALTIDVEDWFMTQDLSLDIKEFASCEDRIEKSTATILELLARNKVKGTFFILGCIAQRHPILVKNIQVEGHQIGSHGTWHQMVCEMTPETFRESLLYSKKILEDITGQEVNFYRAPSWSISRESLWALEILEEEGFICDSSLQPFSTPLSGINGAPSMPYHPIINGKKLKILEFPPSLLKIGVFKMPFSGGLYLRLLPSPVISWALKQVNRRGPGMIYSHPWETDIEQPRLPVSPLIKTTHYHNLDTTVPKLEKLLQQFTFVPLDKLITGYDFPCLPV